MAAYPKLQLALDVVALKSVMDICQAVADQVEIMEVGTLLCLSEGMEAVRKMRKAFPDHIILADIRIIKAGGVLADLAFQAGANWVTVMSDATQQTLEAVVKSAKNYNGEVQVELNDQWTWEQTKGWRALGIDQIIIHRTAELKGLEEEEAWSSDIFSVVKRLHEMGFKVTITGGVTPADVKRFEGIPVYIFIAGRAILKAPVPQEAALAMKETIEAVY